ncbi:MAG: WYL domain-containing protein [Vulcanimicrobiota bacterium]
MVEKTLTLIRDQEWYLPGIYMKKQEQRYYKVRRIKEVEVLNKTFTQSGHVDAIPLSVPWDFSNRDPEEVSILIDNTLSLHMKEHILHPTQSIEMRAAGGLRFKVSVRAPLLMVSWILSLGTHAEVEYPPDLRKLVAEEAHKISMKYTPQ